MILLFFVCFFKRVVRCSIIDTCATEREYKDRHTETIGTLLTNTSDCTLVLAITMSMVFRL